MSKYITCILLFIAQFVSAQLVTLSADGSGGIATYDLITDALAPGYNPIEVPDCGHESFGDHIDEVFDADLNADVFRFFIHVNEDDDRCINFDRQRNEIKTYDQSPDNLKGIEGELVEYKWKFKLDAGLQSSPKFTHIHQLKAVGGSESSTPLITLTTRKGTPDEFELRYAEVSSPQISLLETDLAPFLGVWCEVEETVLYGENGTYSITIKKVSDQSTLLTYTNNDIRMWRTDAEFVRPKWGIYRSLLFEEDLRDEEVLFNDFSIEEIEEPLPVDLVSFTAKRITNNVQLDWQTASEENNKGFEIEHSIDGRGWTKLNFVDGRGTSNTKNDYQFIDRRPLVGANYYRLKQIDFDESFEYSKTIMVLIDKKNEDIQVVPNPSNGSINLNGLSEDTFVKVYNKTGIVREVLSNNSKLDLQNLPAGVYYLRFYSGQNHIVRRLVKY